MPTTTNEEATAAESTPNFEDSLAELQQIVGELEDGTIGLEESLQRFETGIGLLRTCYSVLHNAEQKIELLTGLDADGNAQITDFDASATVDKNAGGAGKRSARKSKAKSTAPADDDATEEEGGKTLF